MDSWSEASRGFGGRIQDFPLTSVLQILELGRKTGFLYVRSFPKVAFLVFRDGGVVQAVSSLRRMGLGELLLAENLIQQADLTHALETQRRSPRKQMLGEIFETLGFVNHAQIIAALTKQMKEIVRWVLAWETGDFTFYAGKEKPEEMRGQEEEMILPVGIVVQEVLQGMISEKDRRRHPRVPVSIKVVEKRSGRDHQVGTTRDVSAGGLFVLAEQLPPLGTEVDLELWIPSLIEPAPARCRVVRLAQTTERADRGFAVEFLSIDSEARGILERLGTALSHLL